MLKISDVEPSTALGGLFTDGNVAGGISPTRLVAAWFNALQTELVNVVETSGIALDPDDSTQVLQALTKMFLNRSQPFADIAADGAAAVSMALANLGLGEAKYVISRGSNANGTWVIWSDGAVEVMGYTPSITTGLATVTYPIELPQLSRLISIAERLSVDPGTGTNSSHVSMIIDALTTKSGFQARCTMSATGMASSSGFSWRVYCAPV